MYTEICSDFRLWHASL